MKQAPNIVSRRPRLRQTETAWLRESKDARCGDEQPHSDSDSDSDGFITATQPAGGMTGFPNETFHGFTASNICASDGVLYMFSERTAQALEAAAQAHLALINTKDFWLFSTNAENICC